MIPNLVGDVALDIGKPRASGDDPADDNSAFGNLA